jgi:hypothetical protein
MKQQPLVIIGMILAILLVTQTNFLGALVTTCESNEPNSIAEMEAAIIIDLNGSWIQSASTHLTIDNEDYLLETYTTKSSIGDLQFIVPEETITNCNGLLAAIADEENNTKYTRLSQTKVLITQNNNYWCNKEGTVMVASEDIADLALYYDYFNTCITEEKEVAAEVNETTVVQNETEEQKETQTTESRYDDRFVAKIVIGVLLIIVLYFMFEKGPNKGFIRKKRGR